MAHEHTARACSVPARLSLSLTAPQLMATLKVVTHPLIQVNTLEGLLDKVKTLRKVELPDDVGARVQGTDHHDTRSEGKKVSSKKKKTVQPDY